MIGSMTAVTPAPQAYPFASASAQTNTYGLPALAFLWGGTVSSVKVNGVAGSVTNGMVLVPAGMTFEVAYTAAPFWMLFLLA